ncbi:hypothetical protein GCM10020358_60550 [Amorphoplanes nipponensis]|uniref:Lipoprotein n=1 Tax=Actinoplanes nipponensis TaxID=135950 RepID=A0A919MJ96_9ACTN|nr:hypothetical protein [Actinoplanes nipponensis]GIE47226.1 hypothetical protein Ani05nite_07600 [Actinoplanes nipponensis]
MDRLAHRAAIGSLLLACCLLSGGCSPSDGDDPEPRPTQATTIMNTIEASDVGDRLTLTAVVVRVLTASSFVVHDVDLPDDGLLVLGGSLTAMHPHDLVTVAGTIDLFAFDRFRERFSLGPASSYGLFEGRKVLVAHDVRSWAAAEHDKKPLPALPR